MWPFRLALACSPSPEELQDEARKALQAGRPSEAAALISELPFEQRNAIGHLVAGSLLVDGGEPEAGLAAFEAGLLLEPLPELAVNICILRSGLEQEPLKACQRAVELAPTDPVAFLYLGHASSSEGGDSAALEAWNRACELAEEPDLELGRACLLAGNLSRGEALLEGLDSADAWALLFRMAVDEAQSAPPGAAASLALERAHRWERSLLSDESAQVLTDRGRLALLEGQRLEAEGHWERALELEPRQAAPRIDLARSLHLRGQESEALDLLEAGAGVGDREQLAVLHELLTRRPDPARAEEGLAGCRALDDAACASAFVTLLPQP